MARLLAYTILSEDPASDFHGCHLWYSVMVLVDVSLDVPTHNFSYPKIVNYSFWPYNVAINKIYTIFG